MAGLDLFISYAGKDRRWAVWLDFVLREAKYKTKLQEYDFAPGQSFPGEIQQALVECRFVVCLLSPAYLESWWCGEEWQAAVTSQKYLPVRIVDCEPEGLLAIHDYVNVVGASEAQAEKRVLEGLAKREGKSVRPKDRPDFPGSSGMGRPAFPGSLPPIWNIPEARNRHFTGRDELLRKLHEDLLGGKAAALTQAIAGLGGVGKTQLALEYAYRHASEHAGVWWLRAETATTLADDYAGLAPCLGIERVADQGAMTRAVRAQLVQRHGFLLIFDNAAQPETLKPYLPVGPGNRVVVTTRAQDWPGAHAQEVDVLDLEQAKSFLLERSQQKDEAAAEEMAKRLGCLPLALEQAAAYVLKCRKSLADYAALLKARGLEVLEKGRAHQHEQTVGTTWDMAFDKVKAECPGAVDLLYLCAFLAPEAIHLKDLTSAKDAVPEPLGKVLADEVLLDEAKAALLGYSLIRSDDESISIHRLVSEVIRRRMTDEERERWLRAALRVVSAAFPFDSDDVRTWRQCTRWLTHALTVVERDEVEAADAIACSTILNQAGVHLMAKASCRQAEPLYRRALAIFERSLGPEDPAVATLLNNLADLMRATNRLAEAEPLLHRAIEIDEQSLGPNHPNVARDINNLAESMRDANRLAEAEPLYRRSLDIRERSLGPNHQDVATALNNLAMLMQDENRMAEAEPLYRRSLDIREQSLGPNHPGVATALNNLAMLMRATNRLAEAAPLCRRAVAIVEHSLGADHPTTLTGRKNLEILLADLAAAKHTP